MAKRSTFEFRHPTLDDKGNRILDDKGKPRLDDKGEPVLGRRITPEDYKTDGKVNTKEYLIARRKAEETWQAALKANASKKGQETRKTVLGTVVAKGSIAKCIDPILSEAKEAGCEYITANTVLSIASSNGLPEIKLGVLDNEGKPVLGPDGTPLLKEKAETSETVKAAIVHYLGETLELTAKKGRKGGYSLAGFPPATTPTQEADEIDAG